MIQQLFLLADQCTHQGLLPNLYDGLQDSNCEVRISTISDVFKIVSNLAQILMVVAGLVAVGFILYGGILYIVSNGEPAGIKKAKDTIVNAVVGLVIAMLAFGIVRFISGGFTGGTLQ